ncbi:rhomboid family intramembrane serine protease [Streptomyces sp. NPDC004959]|uniref:rhomboid family intramembrane serine protease n=1 Tax=unclassified Streptomyces TaxID=2593676 RepID=UPI0004C9E28E|nr:rhomboid family intramembrane serine protease [Streptomyces sp. NRRL F-5630]
MTAGTTPARAGTARGARFKTAALLAGGWLALLWLLEFYDQANGNVLDTYGISPRDVSELRDLVPAAFLHFGYDHLAANSVPLFVLAFLTALSGAGRLLAVSTVVIIVSGAGVWLLAPPHSVTAGASGVVFGLFGYLLVRGFVDRRVVDVVLGLVVAAVYGSILWGALPNQSGVSWQAHLFGLIGGVLAAFAFRTPRPAK